MEDLENKIEEKIEEKLFTNEEVKKIKTKTCLNTILCSLLVLLIVISFLFSYCLGVIKSYPDDSNVLKFLNILQLYEDNYVNDFDLSSAIDYSIMGLVVGVEDKYGAYIPKEDSEVTGQKIKTGNYKGIGITYSSSNIKDGYIEILDIVEDSPAGRSELKIGDKITKIDNEEVNEEVIKNFSNNIGLGLTDKVLLEINNEKEILIQLGMVVSPKIDYYVEDNVGYITIYTFVLETIDKFQEAIDYVVKEDVSKIVFDLRDNGGGDVEAVTQMLDYILEECLIVDLRYTSGESEKRYSDEYSKLNSDVEIVVLVDDDTASASELFTMVMQDIRGAKVIGETTYGKSTILTFYTFKDGSVLSMSTGNYYPVSDRYIEGVGIEPDVKLSEKEIKMSIKELKKLGYLD